MDSQQIEMWVDAASQQVAMEVGTVVRSKRTGKTGVVCSFREMAEVMFEVNWFDSVGIMRACEIVPAN